MTATIQKAAICAAWDVILTIRWCIDPWCIQTTRIEWWLQARWIWWTVWKDRATFLRWWTVHGSRTIRHQIHVSWNIFLVCCVHFSKFSLLALLSVQIVCTKITLKLLDWRSIATIHCDVIQLILLWSRFDHLFFLCYFLFLKKSCRQLLFQAILIDALFKFIIFMFSSHVHTRFYFILTVESPAFRNAVHIHFNKRREKKKLTDILVDSVVRCDSTELKNWTNSIIVPWKSFACHDIALIANNVAMCRLSAQSR